MQLCQLNIKVRPSKNHPKFWDWGVGYLQLWLFAESAEDASTRAVGIVDRLPYEIACDDFDILVDVNEDVVRRSGSRYEYQLLRIVEAQQTGLSLHLHALETGAELT